jgi:hypothetical protein
VVWNACWYCGNASVGDSVGGSRGGTSNGGDHVPLTNRGVMIGGNHAAPTNKGVVIGMASVLWTILVLAQTPREKGREWSLPLQWTSFKVMP